MLEAPGFKSEAEIYRNGSTVVQRAVRLCDHLPVIIKYSAQEYPSLKQAASLRNEFDILQSLSSCQVIRAYSLERLHTRMLLVQEDFGGSPLLQHFSTPDICLQTFLEIAISIADGLNAIHAQHIIHKDISPANLLFNAETHQVKIIDFGISTRLSRENQEFKSPEGLEGTLAYISPEQTGRMNRALDFRTDLYSLGATFYHLLSGAPPFESADAMELVHAHIAKDPCPLNQRNPKIPQALSDIIAKLMSKALEDRYQSAIGLKHDLQQCLSQWQADRRIFPFPLAGRDVSTKFEVPQRMFGREEEAGVLLQGFERVAQGGTELLLVGGYSGIGKSSLVREIHKPIVQQRGYFLAGKYDQFDRGVPYSALTQAFGQMVQTILTEPAERVASWRARIQEALASNGRILVEVIPSLEQLIGPQPAVPTLSPMQALNRFNLVFQNFVRVFAQAEHPLVLFLDDLQWADNPSLVFLEGLLCRSPMAHLFVITAYRDNEVDAAHPFLLTVQAIQKSGASVSAITLAPLTEDDTGALIAETLRSTPEQTAPLTRLLYRKTGGNPFFLIQLLYSLHENRLLTLDPDNGKWLWDFNQLQSMGITNNVVDLMTSRIQRLPEACKSILKKAACIGSKFDLKILSTVSQTPYHVTAHHIWPALSEGLIVPISDDYQAAHDLGPQEPFSPQSAQPLRDELHAALCQEIEAGQFNARYRFLHDRVQQAAYLLIPEPKRKSEHLRIGRLLLAGSATESQREEALFEITNHFHIGLDLITEDAEKLALARLNLQAGKRAKAAAANKAAVQHLTVALNLLGAHAWETHYDLLFALHQNLAECQYLIGNFQEADCLSREAVSHGRSKLDKAEVYATRIQLFMTGSDFSKAVLSGIEGLTLLGFPVPCDEEEKTHACTAELATINARLSDTEVGALIDLPAMDDPEKEAALNLMIHTWAASYFAGDLKLNALTVYWMVRTSLEYGNTEASAMGYVLHGVLLAIQGDYRQGFDFGMLGKRLNEERFPNPVYTTKVNNMVANSLNPYLNPLETNLRYYAQTYAIGPQVGDILYSLWAVQMMMLIKTMKGDNLAEVLEESEKYLSFVTDARDDKIIHAFHMHRQILLSLQGRTRNPGSLDSDTFDEAAYAQYFRESHFHGGALWYGVFKAGMQVQLGQFPEALETAENTERVIPFDIGFWSTTNHYFYQSLAICKLYADAAPAERPEYDALLNRNLEKFRIWSENGPANFRHRYQLMLAEKARLEGCGSEAEALYDQSIEHAASGGFTHDEALALEFAAHYYLAKGRKRISQVYLTDAYYAYERWGAAAKTRLLEQEYGSLLLHTGGNAETEVGATSTVSIAHSTPRQDAHRLDFSTVIKATQALSREIVQEKLLVKLMSLLMENAGAERGILILERHGALVMEAEASTHHTTTVERPLKGFPDLIHGVINLVHRTRESLVLNDAYRDPRFVNDDHVVRVKPKSVLCLPILNHGRLYGLVYFENNLSSNVFTLDRLTVLETLASQAAISIENSRLYQELEQRVQERTRELREAQAELVATARKAGMAEIATNVLHNVGNVLNSVNVSAGMIGQKVRTSQAAGLSKAVQMLNQHADDLGDFLTHDARGKLIPGYLSKLAEALDTEQQSITAELGQLTKSIDHIKDIVAMQQSYAGVACLIEPARISELAQDALRMHAAALARHDVTVVCEFAEIPVLPLDKRRILLILVNLISNAKYALERVSGRPRQITLRVEQPETHLLRIRVADNGEGIPTENLTRIFAHGFTTRKEGHGFGLHSCALAAQEMGGALSVQSDGVRHGATFTLEIPLPERESGA